MLTVAQRVSGSPLKAFRGQLSFQDVNLCLQLRDSVAELRHLPVVFCPVNATERSVDTLLHHYTTRSTRAKTQVKIEPLGITHTTLISME